MNAALPAIRFGVAAMLEIHKQKFRSLIEEKIEDDNFFPHFAVLFYKDKIFVPVVMHRASTLSESIIDKYIELYPFIKNLFLESESRISHIGVGRMKRIVLDPEMGAVSLSVILGSLFLMTGTGIQNEVDNACCDHIKLCEDVENLALSLA